jgi:hypothetical protein
MKHVVIVIVSCLLAFGCKSSDKSKSGFPFFGGGTAANSPANEFPAEQAAIPPAAPVVVQNGPGPATPSSPVMSAATSGTSSAYNPPELVPAGRAVASPAYAAENSTMVFDPSPGATTNSGGAAGPLPGAYSGSGYGSTTTGGSSSSTNGSSYGSGSKYGGN